MSDNGIESDIMARAKSIHDSLHRAAPRMGCHFCDQEVPTPQPGERWEWIGDNGTRVYRFVGEDHRQFGWPHYAESGDHWRYAADDAIWRTDYLAGRWRKVEGVKPTPVTGSGNLPPSPFWSPDGRCIRCKGPGPSRMGNICDACSDSEAKVNGWGKYAVQPREPKYCGKCGRTRFQSSSDGLCACHWIKRQADETLHITDDGPQAVRLIAKAAAWLVIAAAVAAWGAAVWWAWEMGW